MTPQMPTCLNQLQLFETTVIYKKGVAPFFCINRFNGHL